MKRRTFLQALGLVPVIAAAPKLVLEEAPIPVPPAVTDKGSFLAVLDLEMEQAAQDVWADVKKQWIKPSAK